MKNVLLKKIHVVALCFVLFMLYIPQLSADQKASGKITNIDIIAGDVQTIPTNDVTRISVTDPDVADISDAESDTVTILAKKAGQTLLFLWDSSGKHKFKVRVVNEDLGAVKAQVQKVLNEAHINGITLEENLDLGKVMVSGDLSKEDKDRMDDILEPFSDNLMSLVKVEKSEDLVEVDMEVVEVSTTLVENLGITWANTSAAASTTASSTPSTTGSTGGGGLQLNYTETQPSTNGSFGDLFKVGNFNRAFQLQATVNALLSEGKAKLISKPRLVVVSGKQASFLVGGEIPIESTTTNATGGSTTENTTYTQYGVNMTVTPTIREGKIDVVLNVDIRDVDNSSSFSTNSSVAFITRTASTDLLMDNKQTIALAGFIKYSTSQTLSEVPFLSKIPIVGALFRDRNTPGDSNTEMVIILTPVVLTDKKIVDRQLVIPTPEVRAAYRQFDAKYEHEPLPSWPVDKTIVRASPAVPAKPPAQDPPALMDKQLIIPVPVVQEALPSPPPVPVVPPQQQTVVPQPPVQQQMPAPAIAFQEAPTPPVPVAQPQQQAAVPQAPEDKQTAMAASSSGEQTGILPEMTAYARMIHDRISQVIAFPSEAQNNDLTGIVKLKLRIRRDGSLSSVVMVGSSGNRILDRYAMQAAKKAAPYDVFTKGMDEDDMVFMIPIVYSKTVSGGQASAEKASASD